jgi:hypothetical protein
MLYHFNFSSPNLAYPDEVGEEFSSPNAAIAEARRSARELLSLDHGQPDPTYAGAQYELVDHDGRLIATILFDEATLN